MAIFYIENYGCQMNVSEADSLRDLLLTHGHSESKKPASADVVLINTCSVRTTAEQRIRGRIGFYKGLNESGSKRRIKVIVMGCMAQNLGENLKRDYPGLVDAVWGTYHKEGVLEILNDLSRPRDRLDLENYEFMDAEPQNKYPYKSFVPISHGCDNFCSYCIVPYVRGREIGRPSKDIIENIKRLADRGVVEVILLGQNVNSYREKGSDTRFPELLDTIARTTGIPRLGFLTSHPKDFSRDLVEAVRANPNVLRGIHLPLQAGSDRVLAAMNRKYTIESYMEKIALAQTLPGAALSTDLIVGFPGETEEDFNATLDAVRKIGFHEAFTYYYNTRPGTEAARLKDDVPLAEKKKRLAELIAVQKSVTERRMKEFTGRELSVLADTVSRKNPGELGGRAHNSLMVYFKGDKSLIGKIVTVSITGTVPSGLKGKLKP